MYVYLAPMEGNTTYIVRNAFHNHFDCIDKYFTPFIPAAKKMSKKIIRDILPDNNKGINLVPQLISNQSCEILDMINQLKDYGYNEFNINLGCPSGTVANKKRGSGMLLYPAELDRFLDEIYQAADVLISVKTRLGFNSLEEWPEILRIYSKYPMNEFIIHPRLRKEFYAGFPHYDMFRLAYESKILSDSDTKLIYNGDIWNMECFNSISEEFPDIDTVMIGRGLFARPDLCCHIKGVKVDDIRNHIRSFVEEIYNGFLEIFSGEKDAVRHMKEIWANLGNSFEGSDKLIRKMMKTQSAVEYKVIINQIFETLDLTER